MQETQQEATSTVQDLQREVARLRVDLERATGLLCGMEKGLEALILSHPRLEVLVEAFAVAARPPDDGSEGAVVDSQAIFTGLERLQAAVMRARLWQQDRPP